MPSAARTWLDRSLRFALGGGAPLVAAVLSVLRIKWLALHLDPAGVGVLAQIVAGQNWLGTLAALGLAVPVSQRVAAASARGDAEGVRRVVWTGASLAGAAGLAAIAVVALGAARASQALLGETGHATLVRVSLIGVLGLALQGVVQGLFAGRSDLRAPFAITGVGGAVALVATLALVPRFGLMGGAIGAAVLAPAGVAAAIALSGRRGGDAWRPMPKPVLDPGVARSLLGVGAAALTLAVVDQGVLLALRAHYLRVHGVEANGLLQAALAIAQQLGGLFQAYLANYAFGKISASSDVTAIRDYTRRQWLPVVGVAALAFGGVMLAATPVLSLLYAPSFVAARALIGWTLLGEFARVLVVAWALGALSLGGVRLWMPVGLATTAAIALAYAWATRAGWGALSLPAAYGLGTVVALGFTAVWMGRRGVGLGAGRLIATGVAVTALLLLAMWMADLRLG